MGYFFDVHVVHAVDLCIYLQQLRFECSLGQLAAGTSSSFTLRT